ncbi:MAG: hypothetical protein K9H25_00260 [Rhodospirillum sp.]|nr:hypothetical protein [Rhodospirillum sp.]MCF8488180.1 hypothetical protein [Rhodospirillum sp.]MCF8501937.1 hypothetical protein [Rhodospirillum sp.]
MISMNPVIALKAVNDNKRLGEGYARLMRSLDGLLAALDRQSAAVADFKGNCESLETSVDQCSEGLKRYKDKLDAIDTKGLKKASEDLYRTAGTWIEAEETPAK